MAAGPSTRPRICRHLTMLQERCSRERSSLSAERSGGGWGWGGGGITTSLGMAQFSPAGRRTTVTNA